MFCFKFLHLQYEHNQISHSDLTSDFEIKYSQNNRSVKSMMSVRAPFHYKSH